MDIETKANIQGKIRKDYGSLNDSVEYVATVVLCWGRTKFEEHKKTLQHFLSLREKGQIPAYITPENMKDWIISEGRNILRERFQTECADQRDGLIHLAWEVNMRLKMQDIFIELGLTTSSSTPLSDQDSQQAALSDLQSSAMARVPSPSIFSQYYFDPDTVVRRAVRDMIQQLARLPVARLLTVSEVVVDTVTRLFGAIMDDSEEPFDRRSSSRLLSGVAVGTTVTVLQDLCAEERCTGAQELRVQYSHSTRASVVSTLHRELLELTGSPEVLKAALREKFGALNSTITSVITSVINNLLTPPVENVLDAAVVVENVLDAAVAVENVLDAAVVVENVLDAAAAEDVLDAAVALENVLDAAVAVENVLDAAVAVKNALDAAAVENALDAAAVEIVLDATVVVENVLDATVAVEDVLDAAVAVQNVLYPTVTVENVLDAAAAVETVLDVVSLQDDQLEDLPQRIPRKSVPFDRRSSSRLLSGVAAGTTVTVLQDVSAEERRAGAQELQVQNSHSTRASVVSALHRELLEHAGCPEVLKVAFRGRPAILNNIITSVITGVINNLLTPPVENVLDAAVVVENVLNAAVAVENALDAVAVENVLDAKVVVENVLDATVAVEDILDAAAEENVLDAKVVVENVLDATVAVDDVLDAAAAVETVLDVVSLQDHQLEDLPQKVKRQSKGIRCFFSRMWEALRRNSFCCCCCCVSVEKD